MEVKTLFVDLINTITPAPLTSFIDSEEPVVQLPVETITAVPLANNLVETVPISRQ